MFPPNFSGMGESCNYSRLEGVTYTELRHVATNEPAIDAISKHALSRRGCSALKDGNIFQDLQSDLFSCRLTMCLDFPAGV